jgi:hypothetical protein
MRITLEFTEQQAAVFQNILDTALRAIVYQEAVVKQELDKEDLAEQEIHYLNDYLASVTPQRLLLAEILSTINAAEKKTSIITTENFDEIIKKNRIK